MNQFEPKIIIENPWQNLKKHTDARIALGRCGSSIPTDELLDFKLAHAKAIDAVHIPLQTHFISSELEEITRQKPILLKSKANNRSQYLRRPDFGRSLSESSVYYLRTLPKKQMYDIVLVIADGLSSTAIHTNILPLFTQFYPAIKQKNYSIAPVCLVEQGRVAIADSIAELLNAKLTIIFIGERPGLKSPDSLGAYMTYDPKTGTTDESRNCISNIRLGGLSFPVASSKLLYLIEESLKRKISGVNLKDEQSENILEKEVQSSLYE